MVAIQALVAVALDPDMPLRHDSMLVGIRRLGLDDIAGEADDALDGGFGRVVGVSWRGGMLIIITDDDGMEGERE